MIVLDTTFLFALLDRRDANHDPAVRWYQSGTREGSVTPLVLCELDYLTETRVGRHGRTAFRSDVASGAYAVSWWPDATIDALRVAHRYDDLGISLTDGSLVALASRLGTTEIATFDERHFRAMRPLSHGASFRLLPADA